MPTITPAHDPRSIIAENAEFSGDATMPGTSNPILVSVSVGTPETSARIVETGDEIALVEALLESDDYPTTPHEKVDWDSVLEE